MNCLREIDFEVFQNGEMPEEEHRSIEDHLNTCSECMARYREFIENNSVLAILRNAVKESSESISAKDDLSYDESDMQLSRATNNVVISSNSKNSGSSDSDTVTLTRISSQKKDGTSHSVIPRTLGSVRLVEEIGRGGMAVVYKGHHQMLNRDVAVKFLLDAVSESDDPEFTRFLDGAQAAANVRHQALTTIHHAGLINKVPYLVMEYIKGPTLTKMLNDLGEFSIGPALAVMESICQAVGKLHDNNIIHRDIKSSNILLDHAGQVFLTDFGLSCVQPTIDSNKQFKELSGTPAYMAPEMFDGDASMRSDVYSTGILLFQLLTNRLPYTGSLPELQAMHQVGELPVSWLEDRKIGNRLIDVIRRATHKDKVYRYKTAHQFLRALKEAVDNSDIWYRGSIELPNLVSKYNKSLCNEFLKEEESSSGASYFDHLATLATSKRKLRPEPEETESVNKDKNAKEHIEIITELSPLSEENQLKSARKFLKMITLTLSLILFFILVLIVYLVLY